MVKGSKLVFSIKYSEIQSQKLLNLVELDTTSGDIKLKKLGGKKGLIKGQLFHSISNSDV